MLPLSSKLEKLQMNIQINICYCVNIVIIKALVNMQPGWSITSEEENRVVELQKTAKKQIVQVISKFTTAHVKDFSNLDISSLKRHCDILAEPLTQLINIPMTSGKFPEICKKARVSPIFKSGAPDQALEKIAAINESSRY